MVEPTAKVVINESVELDPQIAALCLVLGSFFRRYPEARADIKHRVSIYRSLPDIPADLTTVIEALDICSSADSVGFGAVRR